MHQLMGFGKERFPSLEDCRSAKVYPHWVNVRACLPISKITPEYPATPYPPELEALPDWMSHKPDKKHLPPPPRPNRGDSNPLPNWLTAIVLLIVCGVMFGWYRTLLRQREESAAPVRSVAAASGQSVVVTPEVLAKYRDLEVRHHEMDQTVWAKDLLAERHEEAFVELWDQLNHANEAFAVLRQFSFGELRLGTPKTEPDLPQGIHVLRLSEPAEKLSPTDFQTRLARWQEEGWGLENSEWRLRQFRPGSNSVPCTGLISFSANVLNAKSQTRALLRGDLAVTWPAVSHPDSSPTPLVIDAMNLEILSRQGDPVFHPLATLSVSPERDSFFVDPLIFYDLDGDGTSEVILACKNLVFWNEQGKFVSKPLCEHPPHLIYSGLIADFDGDGLADFLCADQEGLLLFAGNQQGRFPDAGKRVWRSPEPLRFVEVMTAGDINHDGSLDVWLAQYKAPHFKGQMPTPYYDANDGDPAYLLLNEGSGNFRDATIASGLAAKRNRRTYSASFADLDGDGHLDLVVISDFAGVDLYHNDGQGHFTDISDRALDERHLFGMAHTLADFDGDGRPDLLAIGMTSPAAERLDHLGLGPIEHPDFQKMRQKMSQGNRLYLSKDGLFSEASFSPQVARTGWSWGVSAFDYNNTRALALYIAAGHESKASVRDYEAQFWRHDIYAGSSANDQATEMFLGAEQTRRGDGSYGGYYQNQFFIRDPATGYREVGYLFGVSPLADSRNVVSDDFNGDGKMDLAFITVDPTFQHQKLRLFENRLKAAGNWIGFRLREEGAGFSPVGCRVTINTPAGRQVRWLVLGDSFRSQHAPVAHFGLGNLTEVDSVEIRWPNGQTRILKAPVINQYHAVKGR